MSEDTLSQVVQLIKDGEKQKAKRILSQYLADNRHSEDGWLLLAFCLDDDNEKRFCLNKVLEEKPKDERALQMIAKLDEASSSYPALDSVVSPKDATVQIPPWMMSDFLVQMGAETASATEGDFPQMNSQEAWETEGWYQEIEEPEPVEPPDEDKSGEEEPHEEEKVLDSKKPRPLLSVLVALAMTAGASAAVFFLGNGTDVTCERVDGDTVNCKLIPQVMGLVELGRESVNGVYEARVAEDCDDGCTYRVELDTEDGVEPVSPFSTSSYSQHKDAADQINAMIANADQQTITVDDPPEVFEWAIFAAAALIGVLIPWGAALIQLGKWVIAG